MPHTVQKLDDLKVKITVTVPVSQVEAGMRHTAEHLAQESKIPGFRPGKATYEAIKQHMGEMKLLEAAAEEIIRDTFVAAMLEEDLETVGQPYFTMEKMVPGNDFVYSAEIALMPSVTKLADYKKLSIKAQPTEPSSDMLESAKKDLLRMRTKENKDETNKTLAKGDKAVLNMTLSKDGVVLEGGEAQNHGVYTHEPYYIPGFVDEILGTKVGEEKSFTLKFPADHYQKHIADQKVDFKIKLQEIFTLDTPEWNDEFAKALGLENVKALEDKLKENLSLERKDEEQKRQEKELLELLANQSTFDQFSDLLVNQEIEKMITELQQWVFQNGMEFEKYLKSINKSVADLKIDFTPQAIMRIKVALILNQIAKAEKIEPTAEEIDHELDEVAKTVGENKEAREYIYSPAFRDRIEHQLRNRKTISLLREKMVKE